MYIKENILMCRFYGLWAKSVASVEVRMLFNLSSSGFKSCSITSHNCVMLLSAAAVGPVRVPLIN